jgi:hypothetical protein
MSAGQPCRAGGCTGFAEHQRRMCNRCRRCRVLRKAELKPPKPCANGCPNMAHPLRKVCSTCHYKAMYVARCIKFSNQQ